MFLHLGRDTIVNINDIIGIFDIEKSSTSKITREYLKPSKEKEIICVTDELPKSFIVCEKRLKNKKNCKNTLKVYISQISAATLKKRLESSHSDDLLGGYFEKNE
jgi:hypothetical protein